MQCLLHLLHLLNLLYAYVNSPQKQPVGPSKSSSYMMIINVFIIITAIVNQNLHLNCKEYDWQILLELKPDSTGAQNAVLQKLCGPFLNSPPLDNFWIQLLI